jgi:hypothetical protein
VKVDRLFEFYRRALWRLLMLFSAGSVTAW